MGQPPYKQADYNLAEHLSDKELRKLKDEAVLELKQMENSNDNEEE